MSRECRFLKYYIHSQTKEVDKGRSIIKRDTACCTTTDIFIYALNKNMILFTKIQCRNKNQAIVRQHMMRVLYVYNPGILVFCEKIEIFKVYMLYLYYVIKYCFYLSFTITFFSVKNLILMNTEND